MKREPGITGWCDSCRQLTPHTLESDVPECKRCQGRDTGLPLWDLVKETISTE